MRRGEGPPSICTIGSSTRPFTEFLALLQSHQVATLVDVRIYPYSKRYPHFSKDLLEEMLPSGSVRYLYLGRELGGYRRGGFEAYMRTAEFASGIDALEVIGQDAKAAFMCCERFPWKCHRRFIAAELEQQGWQVIHIIDKDRTWQSKGSRELKVEG